MQQRLFILIVLVLGIQVSCLVVQRQVSQDLQGVYDLIGRTTPNIKDEFYLELKQSVELEEEYGSCSVEYDLAREKVKVEGSDLVSVSRCYYEYINKVLLLHVSWTGRNLQAVEIVKTFSKITLNRVFQYSYYLNVCTFSYSLVWWGQERWQQEIDYMAMKGVNMALAFTGQESIWLQTYKKLGMSEEQLEGVKNNYLTGPAFLAWNRMGNLQGYPNGLSQGFIDQQLVLGQWVVQAMRRVGIKTILPTFNGYVPQEIQQIYPQALIHHSPTWCNFTQQFTQVLYLDPRDPLYLLMQKTFISTLVDQLGTDHLYNGDQFNENLPSSNSSEYLKSSSEYFLEGLTQGDSQATWVMQGWLFYYQSFFWQDQQIAAYMSGVPPSRLLVLDLYSDTWPYIEHYPSSTNFLYNQLLDFGGNNGFYGRLQFISTAPFYYQTTRPATMKGVGNTMEGINQNAIMYDFIFDLNWANPQQQNQVDYSVYVTNYIQSRYGGYNVYSEKAWHILVDTVYTQSAQRRIPKSLVGVRPNHLFDDYNTYDNCRLAEVIQLLLKAAPNSKHQDGYRYDLVDILREFLGNIFAQHYKTHVVPTILQPSLYNSTTFADSMFFMTDLIYDLDDVLQYHQLFLLGPWLQGALDHAGDDLSQQDYFYFNAKNQVTRWGPNGEINDYAQKQWRGLVGEYYANRWGVYFKALIEQFYTKQPIDFNQINYEVNAYELYWNHLKNDKQDYQMQQTEEYIQPITNTFYKYLNLIQKHGLCQQIESIE